MQRVRHEVYVPIRIILLTVIILATILYITIIGNWDNYFIRVKSMCV